MTSRIPLKKMALAVAILIVAASVVWMVLSSVRYRREIDARAGLGNTIVASIASGSAEYLARFPPEAVATITDARHDFRGEFRRVLLDESWGMVELQFCFKTGAYIGLALPRAEGTIDTFSVSPSVARSPRAAGRCNQW